MKKVRLLFLFIILILTFIVSNEVVYAQDKSKNILILNSYHRGLGWSDKIEEGIISELKGFQNDYIDMKIEYMDSKENEDNIYYEKLVDLYKYKYKDKKFDLIICSDNVAFDFLIQYRNEIFPNVPIVFCGINNFDSYNSKDLHNMTGISEDVDIEDNIRLILSLHPSTSNITVIIDDSYMGKILYNDLMDIEKKTKFNVKINILKEDSLKNTINKINKLPSNSEVLFMATELEADNGKKIYMSEIVNSIKQNTKVPIYGIWDTAVGYGVIGGKITSGFEQGKNAGQVALKVLNGESPNNIPVKRGSGINYIFDYNQLKKFSIDIYKLPKGSIIINKSPSVYSMAKDKLKEFAYVVIIVFLVIIVLLVINILNRRKLEKKLNENKKILEKNLNFLRTLLDTIPNPIFCKNSSGKYTEFNVHYERLLGLKREEIINHTIFDMNQGTLTKFHYLKDLKLMKNGGIQTYECKVKFADGTNRDVLFSKAAIRCDVGEIDGIVGVMLDITERKRAEEKINRISKLKDSMLEVSQSIIGIDNTKELFNLILEKAINSIKGAKYGSILLLTKDRNLIIAASKGYNEEKAKEFCIPLEHSFRWSVIGGKFENTVIINDVDKLDRTKGVEIANEREKWNINSCISSEIIIDNKLYGMLNIDSDKKEAFTEEDLEIMEYMRNQIEIFISKHKLYEEITYLSRYDKLTNIYNRRYFEEILYNKLEDLKEFRLVVFDLNRLKFVNDNHGHWAGDEYIKTFVKELNRVIDSSDFFARYGGDEFIGIFSNDSEMLIEKFEELLTHLKNNQINFEGKKITCSFSYGIANFPEDSSSYNELIRIADDRMYRYKRKNKVEQCKS